MFCFFRGGGGQIAFFDHWKKKNQMFGGHVIVECPLPPFALGHAVGCVLGHGMFAPEFNTVFRIHKLENSLLHQVL